MLPSRSILPTALLVLATTLTGCSDDAGDGSGDGTVDSDAVRAGFVEQATAAYDEQGGSREEDALRGIRTACFALDDEARAAIGEVLDVDGELEDAAPFLVGPEEREQLACPLTTGGDVGEGIRLGVSVSVTDVGLDDIRDSEAAQDDPATELDREAEGLDESAVLGFDEGTSVRVLHLDDGVLVSVGGSTDDLDVETAYRLLPVVVEQVERVLTSG